MGAFEEEIRESVARGGDLVVVLDDDPTGVQSVHGVPVLTRWEQEDLDWAVRQPVSTVFVLTNSRAFGPERAVEITDQVARRALRAGANANRETVFVSRGDSTLRGHFPAETDALAAALERERGVRVDGVVLCPAFFEAGRFTRDDVHYVRDGDRDLPVGETPFAADATFGFRSSDLREWAAERSGGRFGADAVASVGRDDLRQGPERVAALLREVVDGLPVVVNAEGYDDLEIFVAGLLRAERAGKRFVYRTGPSFPRVRGAITPPARLDAARLLAARGDRRRGHGLVLVGSHVPLTSRQLEHALALPGVTAIELDVARLLDGGREEEVRRVVAAVDAGLERADAIVYTSRAVAGANERMSALEIGAVVSDALVAVARGSDPVRLDWLIAKGGITSSDIGTRGLGVRRATVAGPLLPPGIVPVWTLPDDSVAPGLPYVIFPGNVGGPRALADAIALLREGR